MPGNLEVWAVAGLALSPSEGLVQAPTLLWSSSPMGSEGVGIGDLWGLPVTRTSASNSDLVRRAHQLATWPIRVPAMVPVGGTTEGISQTGSLAPRSAQPGASWGVRDRAALRQWQPR